MGAGKNKLLLELDGLPVYIHTLNVFEKDEACESVFLAIHPDDEAEIRQQLAREGIKKVAALIPGGKERQDSIYNVLKQMKTEGIVLVHDAARPFVDRPLIHLLVEAAEQNGAAILAVPMKDTVKKAAGYMVQETVDRASLWAVQTPQAFRMPILLEAYRKAEESQFLGTDDASLVERVGHKVFIQEGSYDNIKLTTPEDLYFAEAIIKKRRRQQ